ncbi:MAG: endonuclease/exonuclease/phosphatase family protein [Bacteroidales bacterium]|nr:endonuclease/exonuclease/phosphatase family protein [Bacteroidales bacterium]
MSYNVRMFDFYDWKKDKSSLERILTDISDHAPDILCLQEFYNNPGADDEVLEMVKDIEKLGHHHVAYDTVRNQHAFGIATFSAFPIVGGGEIKLSDRPDNHALYTDLKLDKDTIRVYNFHLASYYFGRDDYAFVEGLQKNQETHNWYKSTRQLLGKINKGFKIRAEQARQLKEHMNASPYPVILCGDFNETPGSYTYRVLSEGLTDAFRQSGIGIGKTYAGLLPSYRIDYIMVSPELRTANFSTQKATVSDHMPITAFIIRDSLNISAP